MSPKPMQPRLWQRSSWKIENEGFNKRHGYHMEHNGPAETEAVRHTDDFKPDRICVPCRMQPPVRTVADRQSQVFQKTSVLCRP